MKPELSTFGPFACTKISPWPTEFKILKDRKAAGTHETEFEVEGYATAPGLDYGFDVLPPAAVAPALDEYKETETYTWCHNSVFPIGTTFDQAVDSKGLHYRARIISDPRHELAQIAQVLIREGACRRSSIGYDALQFHFEEREGKRCRIHELIRLHEIAAVPIAMSPETSVALTKSHGLHHLPVTDEEWAAGEGVGRETKRVTRFADLPKAAEETRWQWRASVQNAILGEDQNWARYRKAHLWYDPENAEAKASYKLPIARMFDGTLKAVWRGCAAAMVVVMGGRGGADISERDRRGVYGHLKRYYNKFEKPVPEFRGAEVGVLFDGADAFPPEGEIEFKAGEPEIYEELDYADNVEFIAGRTESVSNILTHWQQDPALWEEKAGRVLSAANLRRLRESRSRMDTVIRAHTDKHGEDGEDQKSGARSRADYLGLCRELKTADPAAAVRDLVEQARALA